MKYCNVKSKNLSNLAERNLKNVCYAVGNIFQNFRVCNLKMLALINLKKNIIQLLSRMSLVAI